MKNRLRTNPTAAWVGPLLVFLLFLAVSGAVKSVTAGVPWWRASPEQWVYPLQTVVCLGLIVWWWPHYTFRPLNPGTVLLAAAAGALGLAIWILPSWLHDHAGGDSWAKPFGWWSWEWFGVASRAGDGFDPTIWSDKPGVYAGVVALRLLRMTVVVAIAEELFWRGFLWRSISHPWLDFWKAPFGGRSAAAFAATIGLFMLAHAPVDYVGAFFYAVIVGFLYLRTKSVGACVVCHAVTNLLLGLYVLQTRQWGFW